LEEAPFGPREEAVFLEEANTLTRHHLDGCAVYARVWHECQPARRVEDLPFLHVGVFKHVEFKTAAAGIRHERTLKSSATTSGTASRILLDAQSSQFQSQSTSAILKDFLGDSRRPLLVLDGSKSLQQRGEVSARVAAALSLRPLASDIVFLLDDAENPASMNWPRLQCILEGHEELLVYGFTWMLWLAWGQMEKPEAIRRLLAGKQIHFVHSGGWKKLEAMKVGRDQFGSALLQNLNPGSRVLDFYGLVEQAGIIYPLCESGFRHVPRWAEVIVRDPFTLRSLSGGETGLLQLINTLAWGAPYHSVLTEDLGRLEPGSCPCGRSGKRFELLGRVPKAEMRGCANV
jgi:hypothetical protein